jgi:uncharacterized protein
MAEMLTLVKYMRDDNRFDDDWDKPRFAESNNWRKGIPQGLPISVSSLILAICVAVFFTKLLLPDFVNTYLALTPFYLMERPWTLITYMFVHADFNHLFWNMIILFFFGTTLEQRVGERRFLLIYLLSGIVAIIGQMIFTSPFTTNMGASGALFGVMGCLAIIAPEIRVLIFFVIPLSIRAAVVLYALIDFLMLGSADNIAHMAHIAGLLVGLAFGQILKNKSAYYYNF